MPKDDVPRYWLDLFTEETWLEAAHHGFSVTGFSQGRWRTVQRIELGAILICYLTGRSSYVGLLRVTGPPYQDTSPIWASQVFPSRLAVKSELTLKPDAGVPVRSLANELSYFRDLPDPYSPAWTGHFRGSPANIKPDDATVILNALRKAAADDARLLDLNDIPAPTRHSRRKRQMSAPPETPTPQTLGNTSNEAPPMPPSPSGLPPAMRAMETEHESLGRRLVEASTTSEDGAAFEDALVGAFSFLGFRAVRRSGPGDTDVLAVAPLGDEAFALVIDGKASRQGRVSNAQIDWYSLERHKARHGADHILVVAPGFSGGELARDAERTGAALISAADLADVIGLHAATPFPLPALRDLFRYPGKPEIPLARIQEQSRETARLHRLLPDIIDAITEAYQYEVFDPVNTDSLLYPLASRRRARAYSREEVNAALDLLCVPQLGILRRVGEGRYILQMSKETATKRLRSLADAFEPSSIDVSNGPTIDMAQDGNRRTVPSRTDAE